MATYTDLEDAGRRDCFGLPTPLIFQKVFAHGKWKTIIPQDASARDSWRPRSGRCSQVPGDEVQ